MPTDLGIAALSEEEKNNLQGYDKFLLVTDNSGAASETTKPRSSMGTILHNSRDTLEEKGKRTFGN